MTLGEENGDGKKLLVILFWTGVAFLLMIVLHGCKTVYVPVPGETKTEYVYKETRDTAYVKDSVYIKEVQKGDTIRITEYRDRYRFRYINVTDTMLVLDTLKIPYPVEVVKVDHKQTWLQKTLMIGSWIAQHLSVSRQEPCLVKVVVVIQNLSDSFL